MVLMCEDEGSRERPSNGTVVYGVRVGFSVFRRVEGIPFLKREARRNFQNSKFVLILEF